MKKFYKISLITAGILLAVGIIIIGCVYLFYFKDEMNSLKNNTGSFTQNYDQDIAVVVVDASYGNIRFVKGDSWQVSFNNVYLPGAACVYTDRMLNITLDSDESADIFGWKIGYNSVIYSQRDSEVIITVPADAFPEGFDVQTGTGNIEISDVSINKLVLQTGTGHIGIDNTNVGVQTMIQIGIGDLDASGVVFRNAQIDIGTGDCDIELADKSCKAEIKADVSIGLCSIE